MLDNSVPQPPKINNWFQGVWMSFRVPNLPGYRVSPNFTIIESIFKLEKEVFTFKFFVATYTDHLGIVMNINL